MLQWDETDFIECLEVIPEVIEDAAGGPFHIFTVNRNGIELEITVFSFEEDIRFRICREKEKHALFEYQIMGCKFVRFEKNKHGEEYLSFVNKNNLETTVSVNPDIQVLINE